MMVRMLACSARKPPQQPSLVHTHIHNFEKLTLEAGAPPLAAADQDLLYGGLYGYLPDPADVGQYQDLISGLIDTVQGQGPFDGVMGFSEGGIVAATLLLEDARRPFANFKCGILFSAAPPLDPDDLRANVVRCLDPERDGVAIRVPTAHIYSHENSPPAGDASASSISSNRTGVGIADVQSPLNRLWSEAGWGTAEQVHSSLARLCSDSQVFVHVLGHQVPGPRDKDALRGALRAINRTIDTADSAEG